MVAEWETGKLGGQVQTVAHLIADHVEHWQNYYVKNGKPTSEIYAVCIAALHLYKLAGTLAAEERQPLEAVASMRKQSWWLSLRLVDGVG